MWSIHWDPGAKFVFINRDEIVDSCIIVCFYSINKIEANIHLASTVETRTVRTHKCKSVNISILRSPAMTTTPGPCPYSTRLRVCCDCSCWSN